MIFGVSSRPHAEFHLPPRKNSPLASATWFVAAVQRSQHFSFSFRSEPNNTTIFVRRRDFNTNSAPTIRAGLLKTNEAREIVRTSSNPRRRRPSGIARGALEAVRAPRSSAVIKSRRRRNRERWASSVLSRQKTSPAVAPASLGGIVGCLPVAKSDPISPTKRTFVVNEPNKRASPIFVSKGQPRPNQ